MNAAVTNNFDLTTRSGIDKIDAWYFEFYPYLFEFVNESIHGAESVLEIGLGLGTLSGYLESRSTYYGIDV